MLYNVNGNIKETSITGELVEYQYEMSIESTSPQVARMNFINFFEKKSDRFGIKYHTWDVKATLTN